MPSTARVNIASLDENKIVRETLDHVWNSLVPSRHMTMKIPMAGATTIPWPTGYKYVYVVVTAPIGGDFMIVKATPADLGWKYALTPGIKSPLLLMQPDTNNLILQAVTGDLDPVDLMFF
jgi:hypothetical protein